MKSLQLQGMGTHRGHLAIASKCRLGGTGAIVVASALLTSACGQTSPSATAPSSASSSSTARTTSGSVTNLTFWGWDPNYPKEVSLFNKTHRNVHVTYTAQPAGIQGQYPKLLAGIKANSTPDVAQIEYDKLPQFVATGGVVNLAKLGASKYQKQFQSSYWSEVNFGGGIWALPQDGGPTGVYYNSKLFTKYGLTVPKTYSQLAKEAIALHKAHPGVYLTNFSPSASWLAISAWQAGAHWYKVSGKHWVLGLTDPATHKVATYWQTLLDAHAVAFNLAGQTPFYSALQHGKILMVTTARWQMNGLRANVPSWSGVAKSALLPQWSTSKPVYPTFGGSSMAVMRSSKHPRAAMKFADWFDTNSKSEQLGVEKGWGYVAAKNAGSVPALRGTIPYFGTDHFEAPFRKAAATKPPAWSFGPDELDLGRQVTDAMSGIPSGKTTVWKALQAVQAQQLKTLKANGISAVG